jgi:NADP-dependent aldehyde dehydrogenase
MQIAGRVLFAGVPTGVAVTAAQQHGGPWPSSTQPMTTSVGDAAMDRFLRPVALQDAPAWLLHRQGQAC